MNHSERIFFISVISVLIILVLIMAFHNDRNAELESRDNSVNSTQDSKIKEIRTSVLPSGHPEPEPRKITITDGEEYIIRYEEVDSSFRKAVQLVLNDPYFIKNQSNTLHMTHSHGLDSGPPHEWYYGYFYGKNFTKYDIMVYFGGWAPPIVEFSKSDSEE